MATSAGRASKLSKQQAKQPAMFKQHPPQQAQAGPYQVPYANHCSPYAAFAQPLYHQPPYLVATGTMSNGQPQFGGAHTISRSKDLHKQYSHQAASSAMKNQALVYYDQPYLGPGQMSQAPMLAASGPYGAMSMAVRTPKERGPIPAFVGGAGTIGPASSRHYLAAPIDFYKHPAHHRSSKLIYQEPLSLIDQHARLNKPLCRCRVMYLGSSVPHITKNGLHGIQEPLKHLYPEEKFSTSSLRRRSQQHPNESVTIDISHLSSSLGIDSWLSVWSNGLLLENVDEFGRDIKRFFSIESLHYCAAVRFFDTTTLMSDKQLAEADANALDPNNNNDQLNDAPDTGNEQQQKRGVVRFLPLDAPIFQYPGMLDASHPPVFASIMRRTSGIKVLECHAFICRRDAASNALVRCCTHAYADFLSAKRLSAEFGDAAASSHNSTRYEGDGTQLPVTSSTLGRQHHRQRQSAIEDQYHQVVAPFMQQPDGNNNNTSMKVNNLPDLDQTTALARREQQVRSRRPARSLSTGGTNSQEMTHSDENSLEVDSEDNYAIISRQTTSDIWPAPKQPSSGLPQGAAGGEKSAESPSSDSRRRRRAHKHRERKQKGSSKSLFKGFMPQEQLPAEEQRANPASTSHSDELGRLTHSLDYLQANACCLVGPAGERQDVELGDGDIRYSIVAGKQKRHSKSMQQLVRLPAESSSEMNGGLSWEAPKQRRKAASYQDIRGQPSNGSFSRSSSRSSRRRGRRAGASSRQSSPSSLRQLAPTGSQTKLNSAGQQRTRHLPRARQQEAGSCIYATCDDQVSGQQTNVRVLGDDCCARPKVGSARTAGKQAAENNASSSSSSSAKARRSSRRRSNERDQRESAEAAPVDPLAYYQFAQPPPLPLPLNRADCYSPPLMSPGQSIYGLPSFMHPAQVAAPGGYYLNQQPARGQLYDSPSYLLPGPGGPVFLGPTGQVHRASIDQFHPMLQPNSAMSAGRHSSGHPLYNGPLPAANLMSLNGAGHSTTRHKNKRDSKLAKKSATLATRFRCLSPPLNFLAGDRPSASGRNQYLTQSHSALPATDQGQVANHPENLDQNNNLDDATRRQSLSLSSTTSDRISPSEIVSGQPGFLAASTTAPASGARKAARSKMSWLKRLSLTISGGTSSSATSNKKGLA